MRTKEYWDAILDRLSGPSERELVRLAALVARRMGDEPIDYAGLPIEYTLQLAVQMGRIAKWSIPDPSDYAGLHFPGEYSPAWRETV